VSAEHDTAACETGHAARTDAAACAAPSCWSEAHNVRVGDREAVLCETHRKAFLGVSS